ncbi:hypothetical protein VSU19_10775, partial [Verrucomicrobiales bacterium BCK34]|nr:hypothetical protein [Verrucomicrobiales bacterium BCK34]
MSGERYYQRNDKPAEHVGMLTILPLRDNSCHRKSPRETGNDSHSSTVADRNSFRHEAYPNSPDRFRQSDRS